MHGDLTRNKYYFAFRALLRQKKALSQAYGTSFSFLSYTATGRCCPIVSFGQIKMNNIERKKKSAKSKVNNFLDFLTGMNCQ